MAGGQKKAAPAAEDEEDGSEDEEESDDGFEEQSSEDDDEEVVAGSDLGDDPAVEVVHRLRADDTREDVSACADDRGAGVIAAGFDREDHRGSASALGTSSSEPLKVASVRHITRASSPVSG